MKTKIEETKLTPEILNAICRRCEESVGDDTFGPFGENCRQYNDCLNGNYCWTIVAGFEFCCGEYGNIKFDEKHHPNCDGFIKSEETIDEDGFEVEEITCNRSKCLTCYLKFEGIEL